MRALMDHLLGEHSFRRVAFIRGPVSNPSSAERLKAIVDALHERGLSVDERLISSPHAWTAGAHAVLELLDERTLQPRRDFDVLVAASDLQLLDAVRVLQARGYRVPADVAAAGR